MAKFVILNFEDEDTSYAGGRVAAHVTRKTKASSNPVIPAHVLGSAGDTVKGVIEKAKTKETFFGKNVVHHYSCVRIMAADRSGTLTRDDVADVRKDIGESAKVYIIMHGKPDETDHGFANGGVAVASWKELGSLAKLLFPNRDEEYRISLVMCYGARTDNFRLNHVGQMAPGDLKTSFAYKFFRSLCIARNVSMTACTGAVSTRATDGTNEVETEEWVSAQLDLIDYKKDTAGRANKKLELDRVKARYLQGGGTEAAWKSMYSEFARDEAKQANGDYETAIKTYHGQVGHRLGQLQAAKSHAAQLHGNLSNRNKYGRIHYKYDGGGTLSIINKYGNPLDPAVGEDYLLYSGPLL